MGGGPPGYPGGGGFPGGHFGGAPGGGPGGPPGDGHGGGLLGGLHGGGGQLPGWLNGVMAGQEAVRTVELPELQDLATAFAGGRLDDDDLALHVRPLVIFVCVVAGGASGGE